MKLAKRLNWKSLLTLLSILLFVVACTASSGEGATTEEMEHMDEDMEHDDEMEHDESMEHDDEHMHDDDHEHQDEHNRVPNNDAGVHITSPSEGDTFKVGDEVTVEIELENFELGDGNHWHIYVDGTSWGMVMGENMDDTLRGLEVGKHEISVYLSIDTHEELEDGDVIMIVVEE